MNTVLLAVILIPIVEIYLFIKIGSQIGAFSTIFLVFFTAVVGVYYARYEGATIVELYKMSADKVLAYILPKLHTKYHREKKGKDPRLGITIPKKYIIENATLMDLTTHSSSQNTPARLHTQSTSDPSPDTLVL